MTSSTVPRMGSRAARPRPLTPERAAQIRACDDRDELVDQLAYARSYFGSAGGVVLGVAGTAVALLLGRPRVAIGAVGFAALGALGTIETRRTARQWETVLSARITELDAAR